VLEINCILKLTLLLEKHLCCGEHAESLDVILPNISTSRLVNAKGNLSASLFNSTLNAFISQSASPVSDEFT